MRLRQDASQAGCVSGVVRLRSDPSQAGCISPLRLQPNPETHHDASQETQEWCVSGVVRLRHDASQAWCVSGMMRLRQDASHSKPKRRIMMRLNEKSPSSGLLLS